MKKQTRATDRSVDDPPTSEVNAPAQTQQESGKYNPLNPLQASHVRSHRSRGIFTRVARSISYAVGTPLAFSLAAVTVLVWAGLGPVFHYSDTWQLVINTGTTIITFLMVFLIQNAQNRDSIAIHLKLDELIRAVSKARNDLVDLEEGSDEELDSLRKEFQQMRSQQDG